MVPLLVPFIIIAGILGGYFTPTEAGMVAVVYTIVVVIPLLVRGHLRKLPEDFMKAAVLYSLPMMAVAGASALAYVIAYLRAPEAITALVEAIAGTNPTLIMFLIVLALVIAGDFLDAIPTIVIAMPVIAVLVELGGIDPVHMGVVAIVTLAFGLITPSLRFGPALGSHLRGGTLLAGPAQGAAYLLGVLRGHFVARPLPRPLAVVARVV